MFAQKECLTARANTRPRKFYEQSSSFRWRAINLAFYREQFPVVKDYLQMS